jgi:hypothetical protein
MLEVDVELRINPVAGQGYACRNSRTVTLLPVVIQGKEYLGGLIEEYFPLRGTADDCLVEHEGRYILDVDVRLENGLVFSSHSNPIRMVDRARAFAHDRK